MSYPTNKSIIVAGPTASGKTYLIEKLRQYIKKSPLVQREAAEAMKIIPASSFIHWPAAEKFPTTMDFSNAGVVVWLGKDWQTYCDNVYSRKHRMQYSVRGLGDTYKNWCDYFGTHHLPLIDQVKNDTPLEDVVNWILTAMKILYSLKM